jgi:hypothetical protein
MSGTQFLEHTKGLRAKQLVYESDVYAVGSPRAQTPQSTRLRRFTSIHIFARSSKNSEQGRGILRTPADPMYTVERHTPPANICNEIYAPLLLFEFSHDTSQMGGGGAEA